MFARRFLYQILDAPFCGRYYGNATIISKGDEEKWQNQNEK
jgi:hypothetical protein